MASKWSILYFISMVAVSFHSSMAQTTHVVGGASLGWVIPPGGAAAYATWASGETFSVGDILVFNFWTGYHDVAEVSNGAYDTCNVVESPISNSNTGPTSITLSSKGEHFYICTYTMHCDLGMKLAINVSAATQNSPPPQPIGASPIPTPSALAPASASVLPKVPASAPAPVPASVLPKVPVSAPAPSPSKTNTTYVVGDALGWTVPSGGSIVYQTWAANKSFLVGDILVFNFLNGAHNVAQLTSKADYDSCNTSAVSTPITSSPAKITLTIPGEHFYVCTFSRHCSFGQKLAINVTGTLMPSALVPSSSSGTLAPSSTSSGTLAPTDAITPLSPSSSPKVMVSALTISLMSIVFALFH